jgi:hypothetical protein
MSYRLLGFIIVLLSICRMVRFPQDSLVIIPAAVVILSDKNPWWLKRKTLSRNDTILVSMLVSPLLAFAVSAPSVLSTSAYALAAVSVLVRIAQVRKLTR